MVREWQLQEAQNKLSEVVDIPNWIVSMTVPRGIFE